MSEEIEKKQALEEIPDSFVEGEVVSESTALDTDDEETQISVRSQSSQSESNLSSAKIHYLFLPVAFLTTALLGGLRIGYETGEFIFLRPPLICLVFAVLLMTLFNRAGLIEIGSWFSESKPSLELAANGAILVTLFAASTQIFNSLLPEQGLPFWVIAFCFLWTLWNNLFAQFEVKRLFQSLAGLFGFAFVAKYLVMANFVSGGEGSWLYRIWENPGREALSYFLDVPRFSSATGYIQFFTILIFLAGLYFLRPKGPEAIQPDQK